MKKLHLSLITAIFTLLISSCSTANYFQICETYSPNTPLQGDRYVYEDDNCTVAYNFWAENGDAGFVFTNKTDKTICIDLTKSFFVRNNMSHDYFLNRTWHTNANIKAETTSQGISMAINTGETISKEEKSIIFIPANTSKYINEYKIMTAPYRSCDLVRTTSGEKQPVYDGFGKVIRYEYINGLASLMSKEFNKENSPVNFYNIICYTLEGSNENFTVKNEFYIQKITNKSENEELKDSQTGCNNQKEKTKIMIDQSPNKFYIKYIVKNQNKY